MELLSANYADVNHWEGWSGRTIRGHIINVVMLCKLNVIVGANVTSKTDDDQLKSK